MRAAGEWRVKTMPLGCLYLRWDIFFRRLTPEAQQELEISLSDSGLLLGEYMELVERAYQQAYEMQGLSAGWNRMDFDATAQKFAADLLASYVWRKRLFSMISVGEQALTRANLSGVLPSKIRAADLSRAARYFKSSRSRRQRFRLRERVHAQIEEAKRGRK